MKSGFPKQKYFLYALCIASTYSQFVKADEVYLGSYAKTLSCVSNAGGESRFQVEVSNPMNRDKIIRFLNPYYKFIQYNIGPITVGPGSMNGEPTKLYVPIMIQLQSSSIPALERVWVTEFKKIGTPLYEPVNFTLPISQDEIQPKAAKILGIKLEKAWPERFSFVSPLGKHQLICEIHYEHQIFDDRIDSTAWREQIRTTADTMPEN